VASAFGGAAPYVQYGNFSAANMCNATNASVTSFAGNSALPPGGAANVQLRDLAPGGPAVTMNVSGSRCDGFTTALRSWGATPAAASPDVMSASPLALNASAGLTFVLWFQFACVMLGANSVDYAPYQTCAVTGPSTSGQAALAGAPSMTLSFQPSPGSPRSSALSVTVTAANASALTLPFYGTTLGSATISAAWGGCVASAAFPTTGFALLTAQYDHTMLALSVGPYGGVSLVVNNDFLTLATNGHPSCYEGYPFFGASTGALVLNKTNAAFVVQPGIQTLYADFFGFDDLQVYQAALSPATLTSMFDAVYTSAAYAGALPSPPPALATGAAADSYGACAAAPPAHRYAAGAASMQQLPGMVADTAGGWHARRADSALAGLPGALAATGTLVVQVPAGPDGAPLYDLCVAQGLTVRMLFDSQGGGVLPNLDWQGLSVYNTSGGSVTVSNTYAGTASSYTGPGTVTHPAIPAINGLYTTISMGTAGTVVYVGPYLWAAFPAVYFVAPGQGALNAANRVTLFSANLYDLQVYNVALNASQIIGLSEGVSTAC
jgi:hypothetical protein